GRSSQTCSAVRHASFGQTSVVLPPPCKKPCRCLLVLHRGLLQALCHFPTSTVVRFLPCVPSIVDRSDTTLPPAAAPGLTPIFFALLSPLSPLPRHHLVSIAAHRRFSLRWPD